MTLGKYLIYIERVTHEAPKALHAQDIHTRRPVYGNITIQHGKLCFRVSDKRLLNIYSIHYITTDKIVCSLKWINTRNTFGLHIMKSLLHYQRRFWLTGKKVHMQPLTIKQFLSLYPLQYLDQSRLSRLAPKLFVLTPANEVINLKNLFLSPKRAYAYRIKELIHSNEHSLKDNDLQILLAQEGIHVSLRTICNCRKLLNIPNYKERAAHYYGKDITFSNYMKLSEKKFSMIPAEPGVYELSISEKLDYARNKSNVIYIGSSRELRKRIASYSGNGVKNKQLSQFLKKQDIFVRFCRAEQYRTLEKELMRNFKNNYGELPKCNSVGG